MSDRKSSDRLGLATVVDSHPRFWCEFVLWLICAERQSAMPRRVYVVGEAPAMEARLIRRTAEDQWTTETLFETVIPPLRGAPQPERFVF